MSFRLINNRSQSLDRIRLRIGIPLQFAEYNKQLIGFQIRIFGSVRVKSDEIRVCDWKSIPMLSPVIEFNIGVQLRKQRNRYPKIYIHCKQRKYIS